MQIKIDLATREDISELVDFMVRETENSGDFQRGRLEFLIKDCFVLIARDEETRKIIGRLLFQTKEEPKLGVGEIEGVYISEKYKGKGIGTKLCKRAVEEAEKYFRGYNTRLKCLYLMTRSNNAPAINIYEKCGFEKKGLIGEIFEATQPEELFMTRFFDIKF